MNAPNEIALKKQTLLLLPKLKQDHSWLLAAQTVDGSVKLPLHIESRLGGGIDYTIAFYGIKEVVKGQEGESAVSSAKPVSQHLMITVFAGATPGVLMHARSLGRMLVAQLYPHRQVEERVVRREGAVVSLSAGPSTTPEMWSWSWPAV